MAGEDAGSEQGAPGDELVNEDAKRPPVHAFSMAAALDDLGGKVLGRPTQGPRPASSGTRAIAQTYLTIEPLRMKFPNCGLHASTYRRRGMRCTRSTPSRSTPSRFQHARRKHTNLK